MRRTEILFIFLILNIMAAIFNYNIGSYGVAMFNGFVSGWMLASLYKEVSL